MKRATLTVQLGVFARQFLPPFNNDVDVLRIELQTATNARSEGGARSKGRS
jgi:hypothetical protein